jgi:hypothetical protein
LFGGKYLVRKEVGADCTTSFKRSSCGLRVWVQPSRSQKKGGGVARAKEGFSMIKFILILLKYFIKVFYFYLISFFYLILLSGLGMHTIDD